MHARTVRIGASVGALALIAAGWLLHAPWLAVVAVLVVLVAVAFLR